MPSLPLSLDYISQILAEYFVDKPVQRVAVFGSYARGEATPESDLDLLITLLHPAGWEYFRYADDLQQRLGVKVDLGSNVSEYVFRYIAPDLKTLYEHRQKAPA